MRIEYVDGIRVLAYKQAKPIKKNLTIKKTLAFYSKPKNKRRVKEENVTEDYLETIYFESFCRTLWRLFKEDREAKANRSEVQV